MTKIYGKKYRIMPMLEWRPDLGQVHMFRMPFKVGGMKDLQLHTPIKSGKKKVWANVYQKLSSLPYDIYMKDIEFGFIPKDNYMGWNVDEHRIVWINEQVNIPINEIIGLAFRGTAIYYTQWAKTYNPYIKHNKFVIDVLRNNKRVQMSLPSIVKSYKASGVWEEIRSVKNSIVDVVTSDTLMDMWYCLSGNNFIVPNPITSMRILVNKDVQEPCFNFLLSKDTMKRHSLQKHISSAPKRQTPFTKIEFEKEYDQYINEEYEDRILRDTSRVQEEWDRDPILLEEDVPSDYEIATQEGNNPF